MIKVNSISEAWMTAQTKYIDSVQNETYYDSQKDLKMQEEYYSKVDFEKENISEQIHSLLVSTHTRQLDYSPHQYIYPWVDLQENRKLKSLYSGTGLDPLKTIDQDLKLLQMIQEEGFTTSKRIIFNTEHVVPQSWFGEKEPMKGDLHHLFACEPACNSMRSNFPYYDFESYVPEFQGENIRNGCGMAENEKFEPEYGKGIAARAVFYFAIRYKKVIRMESKMDLNLLLKWHKENPVNLYEKHRNAAIQDLQGNRNPFIDYPEHAKEMLGL
jgi:endonuclease I